MAEVRATAALRRAQAVDAAILAIAELGPTTTAVGRVAAEIGVSQPYVFRLFGSTRGLLLACLDELSSRISAVFQASADSGDPLESMGAGFRSLVADGVFPGLWLHACATARSDEVVAARCRAFISSVLVRARELTGAAPDELAQFIGRGALVVQLQALGVDLRDGSEAAVLALLEDC